MISIICVLTIMLSHLDLAWHSAPLSSHKVGLK